MITADTITDEQIRELRLADDRMQVRAECDIALGAAKRRHSLNYYGECHSWCAACPAVRNARARCAELLNARSAS